MQSPNRLFLLLWTVAAVLLAAAWFAGEPADTAPSQSRLIAGEAAIVDSRVAAGLTPERHVVFDSDTLIAHAPTLAEAPDGSLHAIWFSGVDEADSTIVLMHAVYRDGAWRPARELFSAASQSAARGIYFHTLGNPVLHVRDDGEFWLFYVTPSLGGWATSRISLKRSSDNGTTWDDGVLLHTSPFFNISTLVRNPPVTMEDGYLGLPIYFEMVTKYGMLAVLDNDGNVVDLRRMGARDADGLQPLVLTGASGDADAYLRPTREMATKLHVSSSDDGGLSWSDPQAMAFDNPGSPACGVRLGTSGALIGFNDDNDKRDNITLAFRQNRDSVWQPLGAVRSAEDGDDRLSYCHMMTGSDGIIHLLYSNKGKGIIEHVELNAPVPGDAAAGAVQ